MTVIKTTSTRVRSASLSLTLSLALPLEYRRPTFQTLPTEIAIRIIELASAYATPKNQGSTYRSYSGYLSSDTEDDGLSDDEENEFRRVRHDTKTLASIARTCQYLSQLAHAVLYRTIRVSDARCAELFARTVASTAHAYVQCATQRVVPATMLGKSVTRLVLDCVPTPGIAGMGYNAYLRREQSKKAKLSTALLLNPSSLYTKNNAPIPNNVVSPIFLGLKTLAIRADTLMPVLECMVSEIGIIDAGLDSTIAPTEIIFDTFLPPPQTKTPGFGTNHFTSEPNTGTTSSSAILQALARRVTHIRVLSPPLAWCHPSEIITVLSAPGGTSDTLNRLTHLSVPRRANANEDNDLEFVEWIRDLLATSAKLECVVVTVFPPTSQMTTPLNELVKSLSSMFIWNLLDELACSDSRLCVVPGYKGAWSRACSGDWFDRPTIPGRKRSDVSHEKVDFWTWAKEVNGLKSVLDGAL